MDAETIGPRGERTFRIRARAEANRASLGVFNPSFSKYYEGWVPAARTAQYVGGIQQSEHRYGVSNRSIFIAGA